ARRAGAVEGDGELVAVDRDHVAVAEFLVEDAVAGGEGGCRAGRFGDQLALDGERAAAALRGGSEALRSRAGLVGRRVIAAVVLEAAAGAAHAAARLRALPAGGAVARAEMRHLVEARG